MMGIEAKQELGVKGIVSGCRVDLVIGYVCQLLVSLYPLIIAE